MLNRNSQTVLAKIKSSAMTIPVLLLIALGGALSMTYISSAQQPSASESSQAYKKQLQDQVQTPTGEPRPGRDPASQNQNSLADAASRTNGVSDRVEKPASAVEGQQKRVDPSEVLPNKQKTGTAVNGCLVDYGTSGEQCMPVHMAHHKPLTCDMVRQMFSEGISVTGTDHLKLDKNRNGTACEPGEA